MTFLKRLLGAIGFISAAQAGDNIQPTPGQEAVLREAESITSGFMAEGKQFPDFGVGLGTDGKTVLAIASSDFADPSSAYQAVISQLSAQAAESKIVAAALVSPVFPPPGSGLNQGAIIFILEDRKAPGVMVRKRIEKGPTGAWTEVERRVAKLPQDKPLVFKR